MINITGRRIRELRAEKGITQSELAELLDKTCSAPRMWELGKSMPDASTICKLSAYFGCSSDYLLGISDFKTENEKVEYMDTERLFYKNLENLRGRDKILLINGLNRYINAFVAAESEINFSFEYVSALSEAFAGMLEEINLARARRDADTGGEAAGKNDNCEQNAEGIVEIGRKKISACNALEEMTGKILSTYIDIIKGLCCSHSDCDTGE